MQDKRKARVATARLSSTGYLRLSSDLVPENAKEQNLKFIITPFPVEKRLQLRIVKNGTDDYMAKRKALYANDDSRCPLVSVKAALRFMGIQRPRKSREFPVKKEKNILTVQF